MARRTWAPTHDVFVAAMYWPPRSSLPPATYRDVVRRMCSWMAAHLADLPSRCVPIIGMYLNDELGGGMAVRGSGHTVAGTRSPKPEGYASRSLREVLETHHLVAVSTFGEKYEPTYFPAAGHRPSRVDVVVMPVSFLQRVYEVSVLRRVAKGLQLFRDSTLREHAPVRVRAFLQLTSGAEWPRRRWDRELMMKAWRDPALRAPFLSDVAQAFLASAPTWARYANDSTPDHAWELVTEIERVASAHFSAHCGRMARDPLVLGLSRRHVLLLHR